MATIFHLPSILSPEFLEEVRRCTAQDGVVAVPTESFYALAAWALSDKAVNRVASLKGRSFEKPLLVLIGNQSQLKVLVSSIPPGAASLMAECWPGPVTLIFPAHANLPSPLVNEQGGIGIRCPGEARLRDILRVTGPLTGTSANRTGLPPLSTAQEIQKEFGQDIDMILDGGPTPGGLPSTVVDLVGRARIIREGPVTSDLIRAVLRKERVELEDSPAAP